MVRWCRPPRLMPSNPVEVYINELIVQYSIPYDEAKDQAASLFAIDLDAPLLVANDPFDGLRYDKHACIHLPERPGIGVMLRERQVNG